MVITNATACIGADSIYLGEYFKHINCIELDEEFYNCLKYNVDVMNIKNIELFKGDCFDLIPKIGSIQK